MKSFVTALVLVAAAAAPAQANQCPRPQAQIDRALETRSAAAAAHARSLASNPNSLHVSGKQGDSVAESAEAPKAAGITLEQK